MPLISIIIPVYNAEKYLYDCLSSVQRQTFADFEVICMDDGSTDTSLQILKEFAKQDTRFKVYSEENAGGSVCRNNALEKASGQYIAFLDNDDIYHPQYLERLYQNIKDYQADISCCSYQKFTGGGIFAEPFVKFPEVKFVSKKPFLDKFKYKKKIETLMWTKLYKRELLENIKFSEKLPAINDILFNMEILIKAKVAVVCKEKLIYYRIVPTSQTNRKLTAKRLEEYKNLTEEIMDLSKKHQQYKKYLEKSAANYAYGMFVEEVVEKYNPHTDSELFKTIQVHLEELISRNILKLKYLSLKKRWKMWKFRKISL